jgi:hypothetical protein
MAFTGSFTAGNEDSWSGTEPKGDASPGAKGRSMASGTNPKGLFKPKNPGSPGKLSKAATTKSESLSKLRGKGALG